MSTPGKGLMQFMASSLVNELTCVFLFGDPLLLASIRKYIKMMLTGDTFSWQTTRGVRSGFSIAYCSYFCDPPLVFVELLPSFCSSMFSRLLEAAF